MTSTVPEYTKTDQRAEYVQRLLALAEFVEKHTDLPVAQGLDVQYSVLSVPIDEMRAIVTEAAAALGVDAVTYSDNAGMYARYHDPSGFSYSVAGSWKHASDYVPEPPRSLSVLATGPAPAPVFVLEPIPILPPVGGPSHPDGPAGALGGSWSRVSDQAAVYSATRRALTDDSVADSRSDLAADDEERSA